MSIVLNKSIKYIAKDFRGKILGFSAEPQNYQDGLWVAQGDVYSLDMLEDMFRSVHHSESLLIRKGISEWDQSVPDAWRSVPTLNELKEMSVKEREDLFLELVRRHHAAQGG